MDFDDRKPTNKEELTMQTFEVEFTNSTRFAGCGGGSMRIDADTPADAVEAVKRSYPNALIMAVNAVPPRVSNFAEDSFVQSGNRAITPPSALACDGMPYSPSSTPAGRSIAS